MPPDMILAQLRRRPFVPFRIHVDDGTIYEVKHPELVLLSPRTAFVFFPDPNNPGMVTSQEIVALIHITRLEPLEAKQAS